MKPRLYYKFQKLKVFLFLAIDEPKLKLKIQRVNTCKMQTYVYNFKTRFFYILLKYNISLFKN